MTAYVINGTELHVKTNRHPRPLLSFAEIPASARHWFDYVAEDEQFDARFFSYRGSWYDAREFERADESVAALGFDGVQTDSYFSAVVVSYSDSDGDYLDDAIVAGYLHW